MVSRADASLMTIFALQGCGEVVHRFGSEEVRQRFLPRLATGEITPCMALTEPDAGSDLGAVATKATPDGDHWRLDDGDAVGFKTRVLAPPERRRGAERQQMGQKIAHLVE